MHADGSYPFTEVDLQSQQLHKVVISAKRRLRVVRY